MPGDLDERWKVVVDLLERGASEVIISSEGIIVRRISETSPDKTATDTHVNINVSATAVATAQSISVIQPELASIRDELIETRPKQADEIRSRLDALEKELSRPNPRKRKLRDFFRWAADLDWKTYVRLVKLVIEYVGSAA